MKQKSRTKKILSFLKEIDKAKFVERKIHLSESGRLENDAEHSWHLAMFLILFQKEFKGLNMEKMLKMALIHDLVEIYAGDTFSFDKEAKKGQRKREQKAAKKLLKLLPADIQKEFSRLIKDFEDLKSKEAKVVKSIDRIQPMVLHILNGGKTMQKYGFTSKDIEEYVKPHTLHHLTIAEIYEHLFKEIKERKLVSK